MPGNGPDELIDRRRLKRRLGLWRAVAVLAVLAAGLLAVDSAKSTCSAAPMSPASG
jgi:hypothetical protein